MFATVFETCLNRFHMFLYLAEKLLKIVLKRVETFLKLGWNGFRHVLNCFENLSETC